MSPSARTLANVEEFILARLGRPRATSEDTAQIYSTFTTNFKPSKDYESLLVKAYKIRGQAVKAFQRRETWETSLESRTPEAYALTLCERAIADAARQRFSGEQGAEETLRAFWAGYCDTVRILEAGISVELDILQRALRSVPGSGEVWAQYIRSLNALRTKTKRQFKAPQFKPTAVGACRRAFDLCREAIYSESADEDRRITMVAALETGIELAASPTGDLRLRLEKYLTSMYLDANMADSAIEVWNIAAKHYKTS
ncbi:hypothetical protein K438DRAFT_1972957 [Mycena galopus ATCC 62051]|nr:hypothetical protein K438DRAFT_1972957 [Mycena galopus ATCC 62051]